MIKDKVLPVRLTDEQMHAVEELARKLGLGKAAVMRMALMRLAEAEGMRVSQIRRQV